MLSLPAAAAKRLSSLSSDLSRLKQKPNAPLLPVSQAGEIRVRIARPAQRAQAVQQSGELLSCDPGQLADPLLVKLVDTVAKLDASLLVSLC